MKLLVINTVPTEKNGVTNVIFNLHGAMDKAGMQMDLLSINQPDSEYVSKIENAGGKVYVLNRSIAHPVRYIRALAAIIRSNGYHAVHAHGNSATLALEMVAAKLGGCKVRIAHSHNTTCRYMTVHRLLSPLFQACCTNRLACGTDAGKWLYGEKDFTVINNGIDTEKFRFSQQSRLAQRQALGISFQRRIISHVGAFNEAKNQRFLVDVLSCLVDGGDDYGLLLLGDGHLRSEVEEYVKSCGLEDRVIIPGDGQQVSACLAASDLFCMPSLFEGLPLTMMEAQANGLRCVVSENITHEADKTGNVHFLSLETGASEWAAFIRQFAMTEDRSIQSDEAITKIKACGYGIRTEAEKMRSYYCRETGVK